MHSHAPSITTAGSSERPDLCGIPRGDGHHAAGSNATREGGAHTLDDVALHRGRAAGRVTFPDAGTAMELLERSGFRIPEDGVTTVAQRRTFDKEGLLGFVRTRASLAYNPGAPAAVRDRFLAEVKGRVDELRRHVGTSDQTFVRRHVLCTRSDRVVHRERSRRGGTAAFLRNCCGSCHRGRRAAAYFFVLGGPERSRAPWATQHLGRRGGNDCGAPG